MSPMNKKGPPPGEQEKKKTTVQVNSRFIVIIYSVFTIAVFKLLSSLNIVYPTGYPASRAFLSGKSFSMHDVVRVSGISRCWLVYVLKSATRNTRDANDIVHA